MLLLWPFDDSRGPFKKKEPLALAKVQSEDSSFLCADAGAATTRLMCRRMLLLPAWPLGRKPDCHISRWNHIALRKLSSRDVLQLAHCACGWPSGAGPKVVASGSQSVRIENPLRTCISACDQFICALASKLPLLNFCCTILRPECSTRCPLPRRWSPSPSLCSQSLLPKRLIPAHSAWRHMRKLCGPLRRWYLIFEIQDAMRLVRGCSHQHFRSRCKARNLPFTTGP
jgi:hypothetical protein